MKKNASGKLMDFPEAFLVERIFCREIRSRFFVELCFLSNNARIFLEKYGNECTKI